MQNSGDSTNPVLMPLSRRMKVNLVLDAKGHAVLLHDKPWADELSWVEFDADMKTLTFVCEDGNMVDLGFPIHAPVAKCLRTAEEMFVALIQGQQISQEKRLSIIKRDTSA